MARHEMTLRIFRILHYLETTRQGLMVSEIHQRLNDDGFSVDKRTVHRDIELLEQAHIPLDKEGSPPESRWRISPFAEIKQNIQFSYQEIFSLFVARKSLEHLRGTPIYSALDSVFTKIEKVLGKNSEAFAELLANIEFRPHITWHTSISPVILDTIYHALEEGHPLHINYRAGAGENPGQAKQRKVGPECLYFADGGVYLIAIDIDKNEPRTYALGRVLDAEMLNNEIYDKKGYSPEKMFKSAFGVLNTGTVSDIEILVHGPLASYLSERRWHESQETIKNSDGTIFKFQVKMNDELVRFVLGMGPSATVIKPAELKQAVSLSAQQILSLYVKKAA